MTTPKHTQEPWSDAPLAKGNIILPETDWKRAVACVNACKGFTEEELETLGHYKAFHDTIIAENEQLRKELSKLKGDSNGTN